MGLFNRKMQEVNLRNPEEVTREIMRLLDKGKKEDAINLLHSARPTLQESDFIKVVYVVNAAINDIRNKQINNIGNGLNNTASRMSSVTSDYQSRMDKMRESEKEMDRQRAEILNSITGGRRR